MATFTLSPFLKSINSILSGTPSVLDTTLKLALLDQASAVTEDLTATGDEFLADLTGYNILSEVTLVSPTLTNLLLSCDASATGEMPDPGSGNTADKIILYSDTGSAATSRLLGIATLSSAIVGDDVADDLQVPSGLLNFNA